MTSRPIKDKVVLHRPRWSAAGFPAHRLQLRGSRDPGPAGTIRPHEAPYAAALREAREETGFTQFRIVRQLGETTYDEPTPERWASQELHDGEQDPTSFECFWIPLQAARVLQAGQGALLGALYD